MNGVLGKPALARQDAAIGVGRTQRLGARWRQSPNADGSNPTVPDLTGYTGVIQIVSNDGELWLEKPLAIDHLSGLFSVKITPADTSAPIWRARTTGSWSLIATGPDSTVTVLATGDMRIIQGGIA